MTGEYPKLPAVPAEMAGLTRSLSEALDKVAALPLAEVLGDARQALGTATQLMQSANVGMGPLIASLRQTSESANAGIRSLNAAYGRDSQMRVEVSDLLRQLQATARSTRALTDYLERHPESVIRGRAGPAQ
jgi:paraquat-inducible protein B